MADAESCMDHHMADAESESYVGHPMADAESCMDHHMADAESES